MSNTTDLGIPVTIVFFPICVPKNCFPPIFFLKTEKAPGDRRQCLNTVLNNLNLDQAFSPLFLKSERGEREENSSREKHRGIVGRGRDLRITFAY